jgi:hypothetical protein
MRPEQTPSVFGVALERLLLVFLAMLAALAILSMAPSVPGPAQHVPDARSINAEPHPDTPRIQSVVHTDNPAQAAPSQDAAG